MGGIITIPYTLRRWAKLLHDSKQRWKVLVLHRRAGKTVAVINHLIKDAIIAPQSRYAYIAPTYKQAKNIAWDYLKHYVQPIPGVKPNESELKVDFPNGSRVQLFGSENIDALRGMALWGGAQDESSQQPSNLFSEVISKCLADHLGYWIWLGTPKGKNQFHRTYQTSINNPDYFSLFRNIDDSLAQETGETIENLKIALEDDRKLVANGEMTREEFEQEWYCSFEAAIKGAIYASELHELREQGRIKSIPYDKALLVHTVWDLGKGANMAIGFYQKYDRDVRMIDYWEGSENDGLPAAIKAVKDKPYIYGKHFAPHDIAAVDMATETTRIQTAKELGLKFEIKIENDKTVSVVPKLLVSEGINSGKLMFSRLWVDEQKCQIWLDALNQYRRDWDENRGMFKDEPLHDWTSHAADVHRYMSLVEKWMHNEEYLDVNIFGRKKTFK